MNPFIMDGPISPGGPVMKLFRIIGKIIEIITKPPKAKETPEDVAERNRAFRSFCDQVNGEARQIEAYVIQQLDAYGGYLSALSDSKEYPFLQQYKVNTKFLHSQLDLLKMQIPGIIGGEVSRHLSDTDAECLKIRRMLPGAEKEMKMQEFLSAITGSALEKCAQTTSAIIGQVRDLFIEDLQECLHASRRQLEQTEAELTEIMEPADSTVEREQICAQARYVANCCELVLTILT